MPLGKRASGLGLMAIVIASACLVASPAWACGQAGQLSGPCEEENVTAGLSDGSADLTGSVTGGSSSGSNSAGSGGSSQSGSDGSQSPGAGGSGTSTGEWSGGGSSSAEPFDPRTLGDNGFGDYDATCRFLTASLCVGLYIPDAGPGTPADATDPAPAAGDTAVTIITLTDIASFVPRSAVQYMEPDGWMVVGLPTNVYAEIDQHVVSGELLDEPAEVRFTPVAYGWDYGDGTLATHTVRGGTWAAQGLREFDATTTSHPYTTAGTYTITLTVAYSAEYRFAGGAWTPIAGALELPANPLTATAVDDAVTVLVDRDCRLAPGGPGC